MRGRTFVLMRLKTNETGSVVRLVGRLAGVERVHRLRGPYDLVVHVEPNAVGSVEAMGNLPGVERVVVCTSALA